MLNPDNQQYKHSKTINTSNLFQWMPTSALIIDRNGNIQEVNQQALKFFGKLSQDTFLKNYQFSSLVINLSRSIELIEEICSSKNVITKQILLRRLDNSIACVNISACTFPDSPNLILLQFTVASLKSHTLLTQMIQTFRVEIQRLKPYLNKPGKELLDQIVTNNALETRIKDFPNGINQLDIFNEERVLQLTNLFPELTNNELTICIFLSLKVTIDEIASLTGKTSNCLRVSFHRILHKTNLSSGKELLRKLESIK